MSDAQITLPLGPLRGAVRPTHRVFYNIPYAQVCCNGNTPFRREVINWPTNVDISTGSDRRTQMESTQEVGAKMGGS
ncbi:hypothetical protein BC936DRAFT_140403 [Jimgerdemannia flammicorona]|uniref:Uncharacterized protein n=1 Tax=Jimgerdemannia flammicorona TaxID=994334 RepID=A0A433AUK0_9FUNG|nr:hypothetical protein BC936DRAFT_140403 [Jimgerdemannia flammicorona]